MADGNTAADSDMFTRCEMGQANTLDPILSTATGIPSVPSAEMFLSPVMILETRPAFAKSKKKLFPSYLRSWASQRSLECCFQIPCRLEFSVLSQGSMNSPHWQTQGSPSC
jgi:hypothetical protein